MLDVFFITEKSVGIDEHGFDVRFYELFLIDKNEKMLINHLTMACKCCVSSWLP